MKKLLILAGCLMMAAQPAAAQFRQPYPNAPPNGDRYRDTSPARLIDQLARRIDNDLKMRIISRQDGQWLVAEANRLRRLDYQYGNDGFSAWERCDLTGQVDRLRFDVLAAEQNRFGQGSVISRRPVVRCDPRDYRSDNNVPRNYRPDGDRYGNQPYDGQRYEDRDDQRYGDRDERVMPRDRDDDDRGAYQDEPRGAYSEDLRVGDQAPVNLGVLPPELAGRYRDGNGIYYRYEDGTIYQIDSRTNTIRWIGEAPE